MGIKSESEFIENFNKLNSDFFIYKENEKIFLKSNIHNDWLPFSIDFLSNKILRRKNQLGLNQEIAKAVGIKKDYKPKVLDTTAGLGRDSFMLASLGCEVVMLERNPVIFLLLQNGLNIALNNENTSEIIKKMRLINENSINFLKNKLENFDVIYIDPMFPKSKKSRLVKKDMQIFREIVGDDLDSVELLKLALKQNVKRIVVKRMINSENIADIKPNFEIKGKITRFDVYTPINN